MASTIVNTFEKLLQLSAQSLIRSPGTLLANSHVSRAAISAVLTKFYFVFTFVLFPEYSESQIITDILTQID